MKEILSKGLCGVWYANDFFWFVITYQKTLEVPHKMKSITWALCIKYLCLLLSWERLECDTMYVRRVPYTIRSIGYRIIVLQQRTDKISSANSELQRLRDCCFCLCITTIAQQELSLWFGANFSISILKYNEYGKIQFIPQV